MPGRFQWKILPLIDAANGKTENFFSLLCMPLLRPSRDEDIAAITAIYAHHALHGTGTFEANPPSAGDMAARRSDERSKGLPYLVAEQDGKIPGFAYGNWFKPRPA
ncbi:Phosphinothricin N-acetyltransferase [Polaromonas sp. CG9_12]|nr:Phosphinothricin N-acetyltransferase [Polaromonas sp. CG9_12]